ncbi:MAG: heavy-metal-associated domain-containing protein [Rikenellaceae bacterium]
MKKLLNLLLVALMGLFITINANAQTKKTTQTVVYKVSIHCEDCKRKIEKSIPFEKGVKDLNVDMNTHKVSITYDPVKTDSARLKKALEKLKFTVS